MKACFWLHGSLVSIRNSLIQSCMLTSSKCIFNSSQATIRFQILILWLLNLPGKFELWSFAPLSDVLAFDTSHIFFFFPSVMLAAYRSWLTHKARHTHERAEIAYKHLARCECRLLQTHIQFTLRQPWIHSLYRESAHKHILKTRLTQLSLSKVFATLAVGVVASIWITNYTFVFNSSLDFACSLLFPLLQVMRIYTQSLKASHLERDTDGEKERSQEEHHHRSIDGDRSWHSTF